MDKELLCFIEMFTSEVEIVYPNGNKEKFPTDGIIEYLYETCKNENFNKLHLLGNKKYLEGLVNQNPPINYGCGKVEVKIN